MRAPLACLLVVLGMSGTGCASLVRGTMRSAQAGFGLPSTEEAIRTALAASQWDAALRMAASEKAGGPSDRLLRDLYAGTAAYYAGRWDSSAAAFGRAESLADDRFTKSATRGALALATNDLALPYVPGQNERLLVHYYGMLSWLRRGSVEEAAVEARRLGALLQQYDDDRTPLDASTRAMLRYVSGAVFEAAGEREDAAVAYRNARQLAGRAEDSVPNKQPVVAASSRARGAARRPPVAPPVAVPDSGDVVLVLEQGFVAHRVEQRLTVRANDAGDRHVFATGGDAIGRAVSMLAGDEGLWADGPVGELTLAAPPDSSSTGGAPATPAVASLRAATLDVGRAMGEPGEHEERHERPDASWATRLRVAWPAYRRPAAVPSAALVIDSVAGPAVPLFRAGLSDAAAGDFRRDRTARLTRLLLRATMREAAVAELRRKHHDLGSLASTVGSAIEHADTRSWHLLPATVVVTRLRLPVGEHVLAADVDGARVPVATVQVPARGIAIATARLWGSTRGAPPVVTPATTAATDTLPTWTRSP